MADQNFGNHRQFVPLFHYVLLPILLINFLYSAYHVWQEPVYEEIWEAILAFGLILAGLYARVFALRAQDRVIRLEERLRLRELVTGDLRNRINDFTVDQLVALRFASDAELPELAAAVLRDNILKRDDIKKMIKNWRADHARV